MEPLPPFLKSYFWDVDFPALDCEHHAVFIIERLLECGDETALEWMMRQFPRPRIVQTLRKSRQLTPKSANFWALQFNIDREKVTCLTRSFQETRKKFWPC